VIYSKCYFHIISLFEIVLLGELCASGIEALDLVSLCRSIPFISFKPLKNDD